MEPRLSTLTPRWLRAARECLCVSTLALGLAGPLPLFSQTPVSTGPGQIRPFRIADNLYYVGDANIAVFLFAGTEGHILLDTGYDRMVPQVSASIEELGFDIEDIRYIVNSHAHLDHAGGHARMKELTGAEILVMEGDEAMIRAGGEGDPVLGNAARFPPAPVDRLLRDGEVVRLGEIQLTANRTGGHTEGCTSWTSSLMVDGQGRTALFICSLSILGSARLTGPDASYPGIADDYRRSFQRLRGFGCEVFLGPHAGWFDLQEKAGALAGGGSPNPFVDPAGCAAYVDRAEESFQGRLSREAGGAG